MIQRISQPLHCLPPHPSSTKQSTTKLGHKYIRARKNTRTQHPIPSAHGKKQENPRQSSTYLACSHGPVNSRLPWWDGARGRTPEGRLCLGAAQTQSWDSVCRFVYSGVSHLHTEKAQRRTVELTWSIIKINLHSLELPKSGTEWKQVRNKLRAMESWSETKHKVHTFIYIHLIKRNELYKEQIWGQWKGNIFTHLTGIHTPVTLF